MLVFFVMPYYDQIKNIKTNTLKCQQTKTKIKWTNINIFFSVTCIIFYLLITIYNLMFFYPTCRWTKFIVIKHSDYFYNMSMLESGHHSVLLKVRFISSNREHSDTSIFSVFFFSEKIKNKINKLSSFFFVKVSIRLRIS